MCFRLCAAVLVIFFDGQCSHSAGESGGGGEGGVPDEGDKEEGQGGERLHLWSCG